MADADDAPGFAPSESLPRRTTLGRGLAALLFAFAASLEMVAACPLAKEARLRSAAPSEDSPAESPAPPAPPTPPGAGGKAGGRELPPLPRPAFDDPEHAARYSEGVKLLDDREFPAARKLFTALRRAVPAGVQREAVARGLLEAKGGLVVEEAAALLGKGALHRALAAIERALPKYSEETRAGVELRELQKRCEEELYFVVADFEKKAKASGTTSAGAGGEDGGGGTDGGSAGGDGGGAGGAGGGGGRGRAGRNRGETGYGANTRWITGTPEKGEVRQGARALGWLTGRNLSSLDFPSVADRVSAYRFLRISLRSESRKQTPSLQLLFDCQEGNVDTGRRGRRGARAVGRLSQRLGFRTTVTPRVRWQDLRIDLKKLKRTGDVTFADVRTLRIIHLPGTDGRIVIDDIRLEKE